MAKSAILLGATGLTGHILLKLLLDDQRYGKIIVFGRNSCGLTHPKLTEYLVNLFELEQYADTFVADEVFCCIGTTKAKTPDKDIYRQIDYGIPVAAAKLCKLNDIPTFLVISALGANPDSKIFYNRTKGKMEAAVLDEHIAHTYILRPSLILGKRTALRLGEHLAGILMAVFKHLFKIKGLKAYLPIKAEAIARCMVWLANSNCTTTRINSNKIQELSEQPD